MRYFLSTLALSWLVGCQQPEIQQKPKEAISVQLPQLNLDLNEANVKGTLLIYNVNKNTYYSNNFKWANSGFLPASTFKIANSMVALETGVMSNDSTLIPWNGEKHRFKVWEQDLILRNAFHYSCVPCYQDIARRVGLTRMQNQLNKLNFGEMVVSDSTLDQFWLQGDSRITAFEQIDFLKRFQNSELPITKHTESVMKRMMVITENDSIVLRGKTGWSNENNINNGWFVGYVERQNNIYYFATNIQPINGLELKEFAKLRKSLTYKTLENLYRD